MAARSLSQPIGVREPDRWQATHAVLTARRKVEVADFQTALDLLLKPYEKRLSKGPGDVREYVAMTDLCRAQRVYARDRCE